MNYFDETGPARLLDMLVFCLIQWSSAALQASTAPAQSMQSLISKRKHEIKLCPKNCNKKSPFNMITEHLIW